MNFFAAQDRANKNTWQLVALFSLAVIALILMTNLLVMVVFRLIDGQPTLDASTLLEVMDWQTFTVIGVAVCTVVLIGSLYKIMVLSSGGKSVAEALGGQLVPRNTDDLGLRKLLNVVEEMAIASGTPAPPVYVLADEPGINAFAAGFTPGDAVIGVTRGTVDHLNRDQLQGVIAHEFSHIFNGDMRLNIRLMGILHGILVIGMIGYYILRSISYSRRGRGDNKGAGAIFALGLGLMVIGFAGTFFGGLIKAAVSRQREYLADASAVQFTRNPDGIAGALKRIGGLHFGSKVEKPGAAEVSHAFFAQGVSGFMQTLAATHPPLGKRIVRIDPHWDGEFSSFDAPDVTEVKEDAVQKESRSREDITTGGAIITAGVAFSKVSDAIEQIGNPKQETIHYAQSLLAELPDIILEAAREPYGARAVVYSLLLSPQSQVRERQLQHLQAYADTNVFTLVQKLNTEMDKLHNKFRLPLMDIVIPALKQLSAGQYKLFRDNLVKLVEMDSRIELLEWSLQRILFKHLDGQFLKLAHSKPRYSHAVQLKDEVALLLSVMAYAGQRSQNDAEEAFRVAGKTFDVVFDQSFLDANPCALACR